MPIRRFWMFSNLLERIRSEEILAWLPSHTIAMGGSHVKGVIDALKESVGRPSVIDTVRAEPDARGKIEGLLRRSGGIAS